jgi:hypothetical protein
MPVRCSQFNVISVPSSCRSLSLAPFHSTAARSCLHTASFITASPAPQLIIMHLHNPIPHAPFSPSSVSSHSSLPSLKAFTRGTRDPFAYPISSSHLSDRSDTFSHVTATIPFALSLLVVRVSPLPLQHSCLHTIITITCFPSLLITTRYHPLHNPFSHALCCHHRPRHVAPGRITHFDCTLSFPPLAPIR